MQFINFVKNRDSVKALIRKVDSITLSDGRVKLVLHVSDKIFTNQEYKISDAWVQDRSGIKIKGLWLPKNSSLLTYTSTIAKALTFYDVNSTNELLLKTVELWPDQNNYLVLVACDLSLNFKYENST